MWTIFKRSLAWPTAQGVASERTDAVTPCRCQGLLASSAGMALAQALPGLPDRAILRARLACQAQPARVYLAAKVHQAEHAAPEGVGELTGLPQYGSRPGPP